MCEGVAGIAVGRRLRRVFRLGRDNHGADTSYSRFLFCSLHPFHRLNRAKPCEK